MKTKKSCFCYIFYKFLWLHVVGPKVKFWFCVYMITFYLHWISVSVSQDFLNAHLKLWCPSSLQWGKKGMRKHCVLSACYCVRGLQAHLCGGLHSIESFNEAAQFLDQICTEFTDDSVAIKVSDKIMLDASLKGETWGLLCVLQTRGLLSCLWGKLMWFFPWRSLIWIFPEQCSSAVSFLLVGWKVFGTLRKKDFLLHWAQTNIHSLSFLIQTLRSTLDFHITFILLHLLLSFSGFMLAHLQFSLYRARDFYTCFWRSSNERSHSFNQLSCTFQTLGQFWHMP